MADSVVYEIGTLLVEKMKNITIHKEIHDESSGMMKATSNPLLHFKRMGCLTVTLTVKYFCTHQMTLTLMTNFVLLSKVKS